MCWGFDLIQPHFRNIFYLKVNDSGVYFFIRRCNIFINADILTLRFNMEFYEQYHIFMAYITSSKQEETYFQVQDEKDGKKSMKKLTQLTQYHISRY